MATGVPAMNYVNVKQLVDKIVDDQKLELPIGRWPVMVVYDPEKLPAFVESVEWDEQGKALILTVA